MLVAISRNSEAKAMMGSETHILRYYQRAAIASREAISSYIDISIRICWMGVVIAEFCLPLRRTSTRTRLVFLFLAMRSRSEWLFNSISCDSIYFRFIILVISTFPYLYK